MLVPLNLDRDQPLQQQLYAQLLRLIDTARLQPGARMPSTRMLAEQFGISRMTVLLTYERLIAEGYLETRPAKGTYVARPSPRVLAGLAEGMARFVSLPQARASQRHVGSPDASLFPAGRWRALMRGALDRMGTQWNSDHAGGSPPLRNAIAEWLSGSRGLAVVPDQIVLANGRHQALHVVAQLALRPGARAVVEDPGDPVAADAFAVLAEVLPVPVDGDGLRTEALPDGPAALVYVTPEHQRPLGPVLSEERRHGLLAWAAAADALVLEDDCDGELRYDSPRSFPLHALDEAGRVILLGGFGASLGPWLTLAYLVVPPHLAERAVSVRQRLDDSARWLEETALADLLSSGGYARHVHRLGKAYASRRDAMLDALQRQFGRTPQTWGAQAGLHLAWFPPPDLGPVEQIVRAARRAGLDAAVAPAAPRESDGSSNAVLLGFGAQPERHIEARVAQLGTLLRQDCAAEQAAK